MDRCQIKKEKITAAGTAGIKDLHLSSTEGVTAVEPAATINFAVAYEKDKKTVAVDTLKVDASFGQLSVKDAMLPLGTEATIPMKLTRRRRISTWPNCSLLWCF